MSKWRRGDRIERDGQILEFLEGEKWVVIGPVVTFKLDPWAGKTVDEMKAECRRVNRLLGRHQRVMCCLLDHYLTCYGGNRDALATAAEKLVPYWESMKDEVDPTKCEDDLE